MKHFISLTIFVTTCLLYSCKKENNQRIADETYTLDSVVVSNLDTLGNPVSNTTLLVKDNYVSDSIYANNLQIGYQGNSYLESGDSLLLTDYNQGRLYDNILYSQGGLFRENDLYFYYYNDYYDEYKNNYFYNTNKQLVGINSTRKEAYYPVISDYKIKKSTFNYTGNNLSTIDIEFKSYGNYNNGTPRDSNSISFNNNTIEYANHYSNQKNLIGIDVNDMIFYLYYYRFPPFINFNSIGSNIAYLQFILPLIINKQVSFGTNCDNLIEHMHIDDMVYYDSNTRFLSTEINITYSFDSSHDKRIESMIVSESNSLVSDKIKYTFYYNN